MLRSALIAVLGQRKNLAAITWSAQVAVQSGVGYATVG